MKKEFTKAEIKVLDIKLTANGLVETAPGERCPICGKVWTGKAGQSAHKGWCTYGDGSVDESEDGASRLS